MTEGDGIKGTVEVIDPTRAERTAARRAAESRATVPDLSMSADIDMSAALALIAERGASLTAALVRAAALGLRGHPRANGAYRDGRVEVYSRINAGVAVGPAETATVLDADQKPIEQLTAEIEGFERRAAELRSPELSGATFTIAQYPVTRAEALITPPHAVALAAGEVRELAGSPVLTLAVSCDVRIVHGELGAALVTRIRELLERGEL